MNPRIVIIICGLLAMVVAGCDDGIEEGGSRGGSGYPIERSITNTDGNSLLVTIIGSTGAELIFTQNGEEKHYRYAFHKLSKQDRKFAEKLPVRIPEPPFVPKNSLENARVNGIAKSIDRLVLKARDLHKEHQHPSMLRNPTRQRSVEREIEKVELEIKRLSDEHAQITGKAYRVDYNFRFMGR